MNASGQITWILKPFEQLTVHELYQTLRLRSEVFVVEQQCIYLDADDKDQKAAHLMGWQDGRLVAYARLFGPGNYFPEASIGRIITAPGVRKTGLGVLLMREAIKAIHQKYGHTLIRIAAQCYLERFYQSFGFQIAGPQFLEDGIPHVEMVLEQPSE